MTSYTIPTRTRTSYDNLKVTIEVYLKLECPVYDDLREHILLPVTNA